MVAGRSGGATGRGSSSRAIPGTQVLPLGRRQRGQDCSQAWANEPLAMHLSIGGAVKRHLDSGAPESPSHGGHRTMLGLPDDYQGLLRSPIVQSASNSVQWGCIMHFPPLRRYCPNLSCTRHFQGNCLMANVPLPPGRWGRVRHFMHGISAAALSGG